ncbi:hypothetical protein [Methylobacterium sp. CM6257]
MLLLRPDTRGPLISLLLATTIPIILFGVGAAYLAAARTRSGAEQAAAQTVTHVSTGTEVSAIMGIENSLIGGFGGRR